MITAWIQSSDFSAQDLDAGLTAEDAIAHFEAHDWAAEIAEQERLEAAGEENCPAGIGFNTSENAYTLHICPTSAEHSMVLFSYKKPRKLLGLVATAENVIDTRYNVTRAQCHELIRTFFAENYAGVQAQVARLPREG